MSDPKGSRPPLRDRVRAGEVLGLAAVLAAFVGVAVLFSTRNIVLALEFFGAAFIVSIVVCATLLLAITTPEVDDRGDDQRDGPSGH